MGGRRTGGWWCVAEGVHTPCLCAHRIRAARARVRCTATHATATAATCLCPATFAHTACYPLADAPLMHVMPRYAWPVSDAPPRVHQRINVRRLHNIRLFIDLSLFLNVVNSRACDRHAFGCSTEHSTVSHHFPRVPLCDVGTTRFAWTVVAYYCQFCRPSFYHLTYFIMLNRACYLQRRRNRERLPAAVGGR